VSNGRLPGRRLARPPAEAMKGVIPMRTRTNRSAVSLFYRFTFFIVMPAIFVLTCAPPAGSEIRCLKGQTVYVPAYSHIYHGDREKPFYLTVTLSIRNTDPKHPLTVVSIDYFDTEGKLINKYLEKETKIPPMASTSYVIKESDKAGGAGASFRVVWKSAERVCEPIIETVMIGTSALQGISFTSRGQAIEETP
jgi:hypothetical protein